MDTCYFFSNFFHWLKASPLASHETVFKEHVHRTMDEKKHGDMARWSTAIERLPEIKVKSIHLNQPVPRLEAGNTLTGEDKKKLELCLKSLCPWRKGPFDFFSVFIDTEWRSDLKWQRIVPHLESLEGNTILDVGCGSGYHLWRMLGHGASRVIGIDPSLLFLFQFQAFKHYAGKNLPVDLLPLRMETFPQNTNAFDKVFSMGVLYHRKSPIDHLESLFQTLRPKGELILETLVIEGSCQNVLMPENRYAMMRNVWFIPSVSQLLLWLKRVGFKNCRMIDLNQTGTDEQRTTDWMPNYSLKDFLDPANINKTVEGYPAPLRATILASK